MTQPAPRAPKPLYSNISQAVQSPCVSLCRLDEERVCGGCFRHVDDIRQWRSADDEQRRQIVARAAERKAQAQAQAQAQA